MAIEVCPTSNVLTGAAPSIREHPIHAFLEAGCRVVIGDDNPINIGTRLAAEERRLVEEGGVSEEDMARHPPRPQSRSRSSTRRLALHSGRGSRPPSRLWARTLRHSIAVQRSITTDRPASAAIWAASQLTTPSWSHRQRAPISTASRACGTTSSERRKTSTMSNGPVASAASRSDRKAGIPRTLRSFGLTGTQSKPSWTRNRNTPNEGRTSRSPTRPRPRSAASSAGSRRSGRRRRPRPARVAPRGRGRRPSAAAPRDRPSAARRRSARAFLDVRLAVGRRRRCSGRRRRRGR